MMCSLPSCVDVEVHVQKLSMLESRHHLQKQIQFIYMMKIYWNFEVYNNIIFSIIIITMYDSLWLLFSG